MTLNRIPLDARIDVVTDGEIAPAEAVRRQFEHLKPLAALPVNLRGWTLDVLNLVRRIRVSSPSPPLGERVGVRGCSGEFTNEDLYACERELEHLHPGNRHIRDKIRQQLQVLRDAGLLHHVAKGRWRLPM